jgi:hypothetical protein
MAALKWVAGMHACMQFWERACNVLLCRRGPAAGGGRQGAAAAGCRGPPGQGAAAGLRQGLPAWLGCKRTAWCSGLKIAIAVQRTLCCNPHAAGKAHDLPVSACSLLSHFDRTHTYAAHIAVIRISVGRPFDASYTHIRSVYMGVISHKRATCTWTTGCVFA